MKHLLMALLILLGTSIARSEEKRIQLIVSIDGILMDRASWGSGKEEQRFDVVDVEFIQPRESGRRYFELMLAHDPANAELKKRVGYLLHLSVTEKDLELNRKAGLFLVAESSLQPYKEPNQTPEPTRVNVLHADEALVPRGSS